LDAINDAIRNVLHEPCGAIAVAAADEMRNDELGIGLDSGPSPGIASAINLALHARNVLLFRRREAPNFVNLNPLRFDVANLGVMEPGAEAARVVLSVKNYFSGRNTFNSNPCRP
jgi:hypothetical protein